MTNLLYLFNPDQDLALASGEVNYMPPASARRMAEELALLPVWFADRPCSVLAPSAYNQSFLEEMLDLFPLPASLRTQAEDFSEVRSVVPWGWNPALRKRLLSLGVPDAALPSMEDIGRLRDLSHRLQAVQLLPGLQVDEVFCGESCYLTALSDCRAFVESLERCLLKAPLSGSGKGLNWCKGAFTPLGELSVNLYIIRWKILPWSFIRTERGGLLLPDTLCSVPMPVGLTKETGCCLMRRLNEDCRLMCLWRLYTGFGRSCKDGCPSLWGRSIPVIWE